MRLVSSERAGGPGVGAVVDDGIVDSGDLVEVEVDRIGVLRNPVVADD